MSSALWHFFWDDTAWGGAPPPPPPPAPTAAPSEDLGSGGGDSREDYFPAPEVFWEARAAYLRSLKEEMALELPPAALEPAIPPPPRPAHASFPNWKVLPRLYAERSTAIEKVAAAENPEQLRARATRARELHLAIQRLEAAKLAARSYRAARRNQLLRRAKKALASLMAIRALLSLTSRR